MDRFQQHKAGDEVVRCYKQERPIFKSFLYCAANYRTIFCVRMYRCNSAYGALLPIITAVATFQGSLTNWDVKVDGVITIIITSLMYCSVRQEGLIGQELYL